MASRRAVVHLNHLISKKFGQFLIGSNYGLSRFSRVWLTKWRLRRISLWGGLVEPLHVGWQFERKIWRNSSINTYLIHKYGRNRFVYLYLTRTLQSMEAMDFSCLNAKKEKKETTTNVCNQIKSLNEIVSWTGNRLTAAAKLHYNWAHMGTSSPIAKFNLCMWQFCAWNKAKQQLQRNVRVCYVCVCACVRTSTVQFRYKLVN